jgi:hypothetical protein
VNMPRYKLRTLLIVLALGPPVLAVLWFSPPRPLFVAACYALFLLALLGWRVIERLYAGPTLFDR